jgi:hypothetical protein
MLAAISIINITIDFYWILVLKKCWINGVDQGSQDTVYRSMTLSNAFSGQ